AEESPHRALPRPADSDLVISRSARLAPVGLPGKARCNCITRRLYRGTTSRKSAGAPGEPSVPARPLADFRRAVSAEEMPTFWFLVSRRACVLGWIARVAGIKGT